MKRRSFLGFLLAAPVAAPVIAKAMINRDAATSKFVVNVDPFIVPAPRGVFTVASINGRPTLVIRGDMIADGSITVENLDMAAGILRAQSGDLQA